MTSTVAPPEYWDALYKNEPLRYDEREVIFKDLFAKHLKPGGTCFEVGCYPGRFLIYLGKTFGFTVGGIDSTPGVATVMSDHVRRQGVAVLPFIHGDFLAYRPEQQFDVVCSFGFIEHFHNFLEVIRRHVDLVRPGGLVVISCPNFRGVQGVYRRFFDTTNLRRHVLRAMDFTSWATVVNQLGLQIIDQRYYGTCRLWREHDGHRRPIRDWIGHRLIKCSEYIEERISLPNRYTSPHMIMFARKPLFC